MMNPRMWRALCILCSLLAGGLAISSGAALQTPPAPDEQNLWRLENDYWGYVQKNDLPSYLALWHQNFLGWPSMSTSPVHKDHTTDWITAQTSRGRTLNFFEIKPASIQVSGDIAVTCYRVTFAWLDKDGNGDLLRSRILHTWRKTGENWQIISGMSMPEPVTAD